MARGNGQGSPLPVRIYRRGKEGWLNADLRKYGSGRLALRNPRSPGWPARGERTKDIQVAQEWVVDYLRYLRAYKRTEQLGIPAPRPLEEAVREYLAERKMLVAGSTYTSSRTALLDLCAWFPGADVLDITPNALRRQFLAMLERGYQVSSLNTRRAHLRHFFKWCGVAHNPVDGLVLPRQAKDDVRVFTDEEVQQLRDAADAVEEMMGASYPARLALELALCTGAREQELFAIRWEDFRPATRTIRFLRQLARRREGTLPLKGRRNRTAPVLREWWEGGWHREDRTGYVLATPDGRPIGPSIRHQIIQAIYNAARLNRPGLGWHLLRHRYAFDFLVRTGGALGLLSDALGHSSTRTTEIYKHLVGDRAAAEAWRWMKIFDGQQGTGEDTKNGTSLVKSL